MLWRTYETINLNLGPAQVYLTEVKRQITQESLANEAARKNAANHNLKIAREEDLIARGQPTVSLETRAQMMQVKIDQASGVVAVADKTIHPKWRFFTWDRQ